MAAWQPGALGKLLAFERPTHRIEVWSGHLRKAIEEAQGKEDGSPRPHRYAPVSLFHSGDRLPGGERPVGYHVLGEPTTQPRVTNVRPELPEGSAHSHGRGGRRLGHSTLFMGSVKAA